VNKSQVPKLTEFSDAMSDLPDLKEKNAISVRNIIIVECAVMSETAGYLASQRQEVMQYCH